MTADERLYTINIKIERAKKHIHELETDVYSFLSTKPYEVGTRRDVETRRPIYYVVSVREIPSNISAVTGDVIQNLRSALDHLAYQLVIVGSGKTPSPHIYFPIAEKARKYEKEAPRKVQGMRPDAIKAIDALKPYKGGNDTLWLIHKLNIIDKHRMLLTVGSAYRSFDFGAILQREMQQLVSSIAPQTGFTVPRPDMFLKPKDRMFPLKQGDELFIDLPDAELNPQMQFRFEVAFGEPNIINGEPLIDSLKQMVNVVENLVLTFRSFLS